jgi:hypothetical protein
MTDHDPASRPVPVSLPIWARAADLLAVVVAFCGLVVTASGGIRLHVLGARVSVTSGTRLLLAALAIAAVRHQFVRRDPLYSQAWAWAARLRHSADLRAVLPLWLATRIGVLVVGFVAVGTFGFRNGEVPFRLSDNEFLNLPARYDAGWYLGIASDGYHYDPAIVGQQNIAFMPALPMMMRAVGRLMGGQPLWAGQLLVLAASLWGFVYVHRLARSALGDDDGAATAVALLAVYPFAIFFSAVYTESIFLLCSAGAFYHLSRREYGRVAAFSLLAGFARPNGFLLAVPLATSALWPSVVDTWRHRADGFGARAGAAIRASAMPLAAAAAAVLGVLVFSAFIYSLTGRPLAWLEAHAAWGRTFGAWGIGGPIREISLHGVYGYTRSDPVDAANAAAILLSLAALWPVTRRFGPAYGVFLLVNLVPPLTAGGLLSIGRVTACMFPVYFWLATVIPARHRTAWLVFFALLQAWGAALFFTWRDFI